MESITNGWIEVITGCMYAGKTEEFLRRVRRLVIANRKILIFKPKIDDRYDKTKTVSHIGRGTEAIPVKNSTELFEIFKSENSIEAVAVDEAQFFDKGLIKVLEKIANRGKRVIVAGLDCDFRAIPFGLMPSLIAKAEFVTKLSAICTVCGRPAFFTQRLIDGEPACYNDPIILIGASEAYEARCRRHHKIKPARKR